MNLRSIQDRLRFGSGRGIGDHGVIAALAFQRNGMSKLARQLLRPCTGRDHQFLDFHASQHLSRSRVLRWGRHRSNAPSRARSRRRCAVVRLTALRSRPSGFAQCPFSGKYTACLKIGARSGSHLPDFFCAQHFEISAVRLAQFARGSRIALERLSLSNKDATARRVGSGAQAPASLASGTRLSNSVVVSALSAMALRS